MRKGYPGHDECRAQIVRLLLAGVVYAGDHLAHYLARSLDGLVCRHLPWTMCARAFGTELVEQQWILAYPLHGFDEVVGKLQPTNLRLRLLTCLVTIGMFSLSALRIPRSRRSGYR